mmetsp:Transcript_5866/g.22261  ORF Transcript_5866/g.22261 Transcript_5866/m.22261 type:complete len:165 (+) Transcript_5866:355-849(+)
MRKTFEIMKCTKRRYRAVSYAVKLNFERDRIGSGVVTPTEALQGSILIFPKDVLQERLPTGTFECHSKIFRLFETGFVHPLNTTVPHMSNRTSNPTSSEQESSNLNQQGQPERIKSLEKEVSDLRERVQGYHEHTHECGHSHRCESHHHHGPHCHQGCGHHSHE